MITLAQAETIIDAIFARGRELGCRPLSAVVVEPGAKVKAFKKEDGSAMMRFEMAFGKAYAALALGRSSSLVRVRAEERPMFMDYLIDTSDRQIFPEGGGMLLRDLLPDLAAPGGLTYEKIEGAVVTASGDVYIVNDNDGVDDNSGETQLINLGNIL